MVSMQKQDWWSPLFWSIRMPELAWKKCKQTSFYQSCTLKFLVKTSYVTTNNYDLYLQRWREYNIYLLLKTIFRMKTCHPPLTLLQSQKFPFWLNTLFLPAPVEHCPAFSGWDILCPLVVSGGHLCRRFQRAQWLCAGEHLLLCHQTLCYWICWFLLLSQFQSC